MPEEEKNEGEVVFQINESIFQQLVELQEKIAVEEANPPEEESACQNAGKPLTEDEREILKQSHPDDSVN